MANNATAANTISGNAKSGVHLSNNTTVGTQIFDNYIGTNNVGASNLGNTQHGVFIGFPNTPTQKPTGNYIGDERNADFPQRRNNQIVRHFNYRRRAQRTGRNRHIALTNTSPGVFLTPNQTAVLTIIDNDNPPNIATGNASNFEGNLGTTQFNFQVALDAPSEYAAASGQLTFAPGEILKNISVTVIGDLTPELDETFFVNLSNPTNAAFDDNQGLGTILDDDSPGKFKFSFAPYTGTEYDIVEITVSRTNGAAGTVSVDYAIGGETATPFTDYTPVSGTLIFGNFETTKTFYASLADDPISEPNETINLVLSNPIGGAVSPNFADGFAGAARI